MNRIRIASKLVLLMSILWLLFESALNIIPHEFVLLKYNFISVGFALVYIFQKGFESFVF